MHFLSFPFLKPSNLTFFLAAKFLYLKEKKKQTWQPNNLNGEVSETRRSMVETEKFHIKLFMSICTRENSSQSAQQGFFAGTSHSLLLDKDIETKLKQHDLQNTEEKLLYCTYCHTVI